MLQKARQEKHESHSSSLARWNHDHQFRFSLSLIGWIEQDLWQSCFTLKFDTLDSHTESRRISATITSTAWLCSSEKRMQEIGWRTLGKDPRRIQNHSSQSTNKTAKKTTFEGNKEYDYVADPKTNWRFYKGSRWDLQTTSSGSRANLHTASSLSSTWDQTHGKTSNLSILQALTIGENFLG